MKDDNWWGEWQCSNCAMVNPQTEEKCQKCGRDRARFGMRVKDFSLDSDVDSGAGCNG